MSVNFFRQQALLWTRLVRLPNLFTLPGDVMVGYFFSGQERPGVLVSLTVSSLCLYSAGIILNDLCDMEEDRYYRLDRPLATGAIKPTAARAGLVLLVMSALLLAVPGGPASVVCVCTLAGMVYIYNTWARRVTYAGFLVMAVIRAGNIFLGAAPAGGEVPISLTAAACCEAAYIFCVCMAARNERLTATRPLLVTLLLRGLMPLQALFLLAGGFVLPALVVCCLIPGNVLLLRRGYYAT